MKTKLLALALMAAGSMFAETHFSIGVNIGGVNPGGYNRGYYGAPSYAAIRPLCPGPGFIWSDGYWAQDYGRPSWHNGYWRRPTYRVYQTRPRYDDRRYDTYERQGYDNGYYGQPQYQNRGVHRDRDDDDDDRDRAHRQDYRQENGSGYGNVYRER